MMDYTCHIVKDKILKRFCVVYGMAEKQYQRIFRNNFVFGKIDKTFRKILFSQCNVVLFNEGNS